MAAARARGMVVGRVKGGIAFTERHMQGFPFVTAF